MPLFICEIDDRHYFKSDEMQEILILMKYIFKTQFSSHTIMKLRLLSTQKLKKITINGNKNVKKLQN